MRRKLSLAFWLLVAVGFVAGWTTLVDNILGRRIKTTAPTDGQALVYELSSNSWKPGSASGSVTSQLNGGALGPFSTLNIKTPLTANLSGTTLNVSATGVELTTNKGVASGYASLNGSVKVVEDPASASTTAAINAIPKTSGAASTLDIGFIPLGTSSTTAAAGNDVRIPLTPAGANGKMPYSNNASYALTAAAPATGAVLSASGAGVPAYTAQAGSANEILHGSTTGVSTFSKLLDGDITASTITAGSMAASVTNRLNPAPSTAGKLPFDAGSGAPYSATATGGVIGTVLSQSATGTPAWAGTPASVNVTLHGSTTGVSTWSKIVSGDITANTITANEIAVNGVVFGNLEAPVQNRLAPTPTSSGKALYDNGSSMSETADNGSATKVLHGGSTPSYGVVVGGDISTLPDTIINASAATDMVLSPTGTNAAIAASKNLLFTGQAGDNSVATGGITYNSTLDSHRVASLSGPKSVGGTLYYITGDATINNFSSVTDFTGVTYTFPANSLVAGKFVRVQWTGRYSTTGTPTLTLILVLGANTLVTPVANTAESNASGENFVVDFWFTVRNTTQVSCGGWVQCGTSCKAISKLGFSSATTVANTGSQILKPQANWSASSASNTVSTQTFVVTEY